MIAVIGAGSWGTALALLLARNGHETRLWGSNPTQQRLMQQQRCNSRYLPDINFPDNLSVPLLLSEAVADVRDICINVPSHAFREVLLLLKPMLSSEVRLVWGTKGIDPQTHQILSEVVAEVLSSDVPVAVLAGPSFAAELAAAKPTAVSLAGNNEQFLQDCLNYFHNDYFRIYINDDLVGVQLFGAMKNVLAIAVGISDGLQLGANTRAALITRGLAEMGRLNSALGGEEKTLLGLAGVGDLVLTCTDNLSRNRRLGVALGQGISLIKAREQIGQEVEGVGNVKQVRELAAEHGVVMPITEQVYSILYRGYSAERVLEELLSRSPKHE